MVKTKSLQQFIDDHGDVVLVSFDQHIPGLVDKVLHSKEYKNGWCSKSYPNIGDRALGSEGVESDGVWTSDKFAAIASCKVKDYWDANSNLVNPDIRQWTENKNGNFVRGDALVFFECGRWQGKYKDRWLDWGEEGSQDGQYYQTGFCETAEQASMAMFRWAYGEYADILLAYIGVEFDDI